LGASAPGVRRPSKLRTWAKWGVVAAAVIVVAIRFIPVHRTNYLGSGDPDAPREVEWILRRACYDCHCGDSCWPIWAYVAPSSWMVIRDVERARRAIDFSNWTSYDTALRIGLRAWSGPMTSSHRTRSGSTSPCIPMRVSAQRSWWRFRAGPTQRSGSRAYQIRRRPVKASTPSLNSRPLAV